MAASTSEARHQAAVKANETRKAQARRDDHLLDVIRNRLAFDAKLKTARKFRERLKELLEATKE